MFEANTEFFLCICIPAYSVCSLLQLQLAVMHVVVALTLVVQLCANRLHQANCEQAYLSNTSQRVLHIMHALHMLSADLAHGCVYLG